MAAYDRVISVNASAKSSPLLTGFLRSLLGAVETSRSLHEFGDRANNSRFERSFSSGSKFAVIETAGSPQEQSQ